MKTTTTLIIILLLAFFTQAQNFRNTEWFMTPEEVKKTEPDTIKWSSAKMGNEYQEYYGFKGKLLGIDVSVNYDFAVGKLTVGRYSFYAKKIEEKGLLLLK